MPDIFISRTSTFSNLRDRLILKAGWTATPQVQHNLWDDSKLYEGRSQAGDPPPWNFGLTVDDVKPEVKLVGESQLGRAIADNDPFWMDGDTEHIDSLGGLTDFLNRSINGAGHLFVRWALVEAVRANVGPPDWDPLNSEKLPQSMNEAGAQGISDALWAKIKPALKDVSGLPADKRPDTHEIKTELDGVVKTAFLTPQTVQQLWDAIVKVVLVEYYKNF